MLRRGTGTDQGVLSSVDESKAGYWAGGLVWGLHLEWCGSKGDSLIYAHLSQCVCVFFFFFGFC